MHGKRYWDLKSSEVERQPNTVVALREQPGLMVAPHWHAQAEVNYVLRGRIEYRMEGYRATLGPGDLALFWGGMPHRVVDTAADTLYQVVHLPLVHLFRLRFSAELQRRIMRGATLVTDGPQAEDGFAFDRWGRALSSGDARRVGHALDELLLRLERIELEPHRVLEGDSARPAALDPDDSPTMESVRRMCLFIAANFREPIDSAGIAAAADIHPNYAMTVFKRCTGMSLSEYVSLLRLSYAQALLADDRTSVLQVALESGFGSLSAFNKCFRKKAGMTPSEFKREHRAVPPLAEA